MTRGFPTGGRHGDDGLAIGREGLAAIHELSTPLPQKTSPSFSGTPRSCRTRRTIHRAAAAKCQAPIGRPDRPLLRHVRVVRRNLR